MTRAFARGFMDGQAGADPNFELWHESVAYRDGYMEGEMEQDSFYP